MLLIFSFVLSVIGIIGFFSNGIWVSAVCGWLAALSMFAGMIGNLKQTIIIEFIIAAFIRFIFIRFDSFFIAWGISHAIAVLIFGILSFLLTFISVKRK